MSGSVPDAEDALKDETEPVEHVDPRESLKIQALVADTGSKMGMKIWIPRIRTINRIFPRCQSIACEICKAVQFDGIAASARCGHPNENRHPKRSIKKLSPNLGRF